MEIEQDWLDFPAEENIMPICGVRTNDPSKSVVRIDFKGFEISISMDDSHRGKGDLWRSSIEVYKNNLQVTDSLGLDNVTVDGIVNPDGTDLFKIMQAIDQLEPTRTIQGADEYPDPLNEVSDRAVHNSFKRT
ncbi:hypothetical protein KW807_00425 [Candidatus Parcubacteria bacterium]|nr:hypothetical protein [Candidatus Parcubacteria bacterium]